MRWLLAATLLLHAAMASKIEMNQPCNKDMDGLLASDPDGNPQAFLSCQGVGVGTIGFWERKVCPDDLIFDFINQMCKPKTKKARKQQAISIAILNNSCANGETCIGGTVCDMDTLKCLCPYGTIPQLDTLSCIKAQQFPFNSFGGYERAPNPQPSTEQTFFKPNPSFSQFVNNNNNNNNNNNGYGNTPSQASSTPWMPSNIFGASGSEFQPNPNQKFVFPNFFPTTTTAAPQKKVPVLALPGSSCRSNEVCTGGSICTLPIGLCLCPGELEAREGECVLPASASIKITKVGIGALCSELAECDHGSSCVMGRCACMSPLIQHEGKCVLKQERVEVGPGELCDNGEVCSKGSICDHVIPVCVCPADTDLLEGECRKMTETRPQPPLMLPTTSSYIPPQPQYVTTPPPAPVRTQPPPTIPPQTPPPTMAPRPQKPIVPVLPASSFTHPPQPTQGYQPRPQTNPPMKPPTFNFKNLQTGQTQKPNHMKISLGGSKQNGVNVRCSLNTDCMIGAYCNGNTNPPSCQCLSTHVNVEGRCEKVVYPGQVGCRSDLQCTAAYTATSCIDRVCVCPEGSRAVDQTCIPANEPVTSPPGGSCTEARQCTGGSVCREGWCICPDPSMIVQRGICIQSGNRPTLPPKTVPVYTTAPPQVYQPTHTANYYQTQQTQQTQQVQTFNALPSPSQPSKKIAPGLQCGPLDICVGGSTCVEGMCLCPAGTSSNKLGRCEVITTTTARTTQPPTVVQTYRPTAAEFTYQWRTSSTRRPIEFIELPTHAPPIITLPPTAPTRKQGTPTYVPETPQTTRTYIHAVTTVHEAQNECEAIGLFCRGNTICVNRSCQCPDGYILLHDGCVPPDEAAKRKVRGRHRHQQAAAPVSHYARPGEDCGDGQICSGGSVCNDDWECKCPAEKPLLQNEQCHAEQKKTPKYAGPGESCDEYTNCSNNSTCHSGQCRCPPQFIAVSGYCVELPMPSTPEMKTVKLARPLENCGSGEQCDGGSSCNEDTEVCMCPPDHFVFGIQCRANQIPTTRAETTQKMTTPTVTQQKISRPTTDCFDESNCGDGKVCLAGRCRCRPGTVDNAGVCESLEEIDAGERPVPISYARHNVFSSDTMKPEPAVAQQFARHSPTSAFAPEEVVTTKTPTTTPRPTTTPAPTTPESVPEPIQRQETQRPRITGPPIRRPKPKKNNSGRSGGASSGVGPTGNKYKTGGTGNGNCPPGNDPTRDDSDRLITCNGLEPNCPPRSYCYITSGGFATEEYNCCKSW